MVSSIMNSIFYYIGIGRSLFAETHIDDFSSVIDSITYCRCNIFIVFITFGNCPDRHDFCSRVNTDHFIFRVWLGCDYSGNECAVEVIITHNVGVPVKAVGCVMYVIAHKQSFIFVCFYAFDTGLCLIQFCIMLVDQSLP